MTDGYFNLFVYGTLKRGGSGERFMAGCEWLGPARVGGVLYNIDDQFPALLLYGNSAVEGEVWRCPSELLQTLDTYEGVADGLFRRVGVHATGQDRTHACWVYVAGPRLAHKLTPERQLTA